MLRHSEEEDVGQKHFLDIAVTFNVGEGWSFYFGAVELGIPSIRPPTMMSFGFDSSPTGTSQRSLPPSAHSYR
jgi:hypothetical protein